MFAHDVPLLLQRELQLQRGHDLLHDLILEREEVLQRTVVALRPQVPAGRGINNWITIRICSPAFWTLPSSAYRTPSSFPTSCIFTGFPLYVKAVLRAMTKRLEMRERSEVSTSVMPLLK